MLTCAGPAQSELLRAEVKAVGTGQPVPRAEGVVVGCKISGDASADGNKEDMV